MIRIEYPALPPKEYSPNSRVHWHKRHTAGEYAKQLVVALLMQQGCRPGTVIERAKVNVSFGLPDKRRRDLDNMIAASKPLIDALPLADDNVRQVEITYSWFESPKKPKTVIEIDDRVDSTSNISLESHQSRF